MEERPPRRRSRVPLIIAILAALAVIVVIAVVVSGGGSEEPSPEPTQAGAEWESLSFESDEVKEKTIDLGAKRGGDVSVIVHTDNEKVCWNGYIAEKAIKGCGRRIFQVESAPPNLGLNVQSESQSSAFVGLAVWDADGETKLHTDETNTRLGVLAASVPTT